MHACTHVHTHIHTYTHTHTHTHTHTQRDSIYTQKTMRTETNVLFILYVETTTIAFSVWLCVCVTHVQYGFKSTLAICYTNYAVRMCVCYLHYINYAVCECAVTQPQLFTSKYACICITDLKTPPLLRNLLHTQFEYIHKLSQVHNNIMTLAPRVSRVSSASQEKVFH